jgi:hypothetical protein
VNSHARISRFGYAIRRGIIGVLLLCATAAVLHNLLSYRVILQQRVPQAESQAVSLTVREEHDDNADEALRHNFYALLESLGKDPSLHRGDTGVYVGDPAFFDGAYINKPSDTILERCAIQPFTIPALTGMPLVAALRARQNGCKYDSYAYQYLPAHESIDPAILSQPCALMRLRGLRNVVVVDRRGTTFTAARLDCANH